jgi:LPS sulfotransferase NodH
MPSDLHAYARAAVHLPNLGRPRPRFVLYGVGRSGSTLLSELLDAHTRIRCDGEILSQPVRFARLHVIVRESRTTVDAYGFKLLCYQARDVQQIRSVPRFLDWLHRRGYVIFHLQREDRLRHALSNLRARQDGFHRRGASGDFDSMHVDLADLRRWLEHADSEATFAGRSLSAVPHHDVVYERDLSDGVGQRKTVERICDTLQLPHEATMTDLKPTSPRRLRDLVSNYEEVCEALSGTSWARFLQA